MKTFASAVGLTTIAVYMAYLIVMSIETGVTYSRPSVSMSAHPVIFWCVLVFYAFLAYAAAGFAIETIRKK